MENGNLFALLIGINDYASPQISKLKGCVKDVEKIETFLTSYYNRGQFAEDITQNIKKLFNKDATKANIIKQIREHLGQAEKGDIALLFFCGHGMREKTNVNSFKESEIDANLAGLACYDTNPYTYPSAENTGLVDKELRYWVHKLAYDENGDEKATVVTIFDCCHAGENTRKFAKKNDAGVTATRIIEKYAFPSRKLAGYDFGEDTEAIVKKINDGKSLHEILPEAPHIQMAACREVELAEEFPANSDNRSGVFTTALIEVLTQNKGNISYLELFNRIKRRVPKYTSDKPQNPQIYIPPKFQNLKHRSFLTHHSGASSLRCGLTHNGEDWILHAGALRGVMIPEPGSQSKTEVSIFKMGSTTPVAHGVITKVELGDSVIQINKGTLEKDNQSYYALIKGLGINPINVWVIGDNQAEKDTFKEKLTNHAGEKESDRTVSLVDDREAADYVLEVKGNEVHISLSEDLENRPILKEIPIPESGGIDNFIKIFDQINKWNYLKNLEHSEEVDFQGLIMNSQIADDVRMFPVELRLFVLDEDDEGNIIERLKVPTKGTYLFDLYNSDTDEKKKYQKLNPRKRYFRVEVVNHAPAPDPSAFSLNPTDQATRDYFASVIYMGNRFLITSRLMVQPTLFLGQNNELLVPMDLPLPRSAEQSLLKINISNLAWIMIHI